MRHTNSRSGPAERADEPGLAGGRPPRRPWAAPTVEALPKLTELTLQTGSPIEGGGDTGGGSTVF